MRLVFRWRLIRHPLLAGTCATLTLAILAGSAGALPVGWKYEMVSPAASDGIDIAGATSVVDGDHAWIVAAAPLSDEQTTGNLTPLLATRSTHGWTVRDLGDPTAPGNVGYTFVIPSEDGTRSVLEVCERISLGCTGDVSYERIDPDGVRSTMLTVPRTSFSDGLPQLVGGSADLSHIFVANDTGNGAPPLLPVDTHTQGHGLYSSDDGQLAFLGLDSAGTPLPCGAVLADNASFLIGTGFEQNGISADGNTIAFKSPDPGSDCPDPTDLYVRRNGQSTNISFPTNGTVDQGAAFAGMSRDGDAVFFITNSQLVPSDTDVDADLYVYETNTAVLTRVTEGAGVLSATVSPQGAYVYFVAANTIDGQGIPGQYNLFLYHNGGFTYIASAASDITLGRSMNSRPSPVTPDGTHLLFASSDPLTAEATGGNLQLFQYSADGDRLICASCPSDGSVPTADATLSSVAPGPNVYARFQSDDGARIVFSTIGSLTPQDTNNAKDVYVWNQGAIALISGGHGDGQTQLTGMSADGKTIFFTTTDRLLPGVDQDNLKLYAAREGGGFPTPTPTPECTEDACQGSPSTPPGSPHAGSSTFTGPGNRAAHKTTAHVTVGTINGSALRRLAHTGSATLLLRSSRGTTVRVQLAVRIDRHWVGAGRASHTLRKAGKARIVIHLSTRARAYLAAHGTMRLRITVTHGGGGAGTTQRKLLLRSASRT